MIFSLISRDKQAQGRLYRLSRPLPEWQIQVNNSINNSIDKDSLSYEQTDALTRYNSPVTLYRMG